MITWTTYGTWLQGDSRGFVKDGKTYAANKALENSNRKSLVKDPVRLSEAQRKIVAEAIFEKAQRLKHEIRALAVCPNHIHIVLDYAPMPIGSIVSHYKNAAQVELRKIGITGRVWAKGFDKRYCFDEQALQNRIAYTTSHNKNQTNAPPPI
jgi:REP element-mobilizing transposase RayT